MAYTAVDRKTDVRLSGHAAHGTRHSPRSKASRRVGEGGSVHFVEDGVDFGGSDFARELVAHLRRRSCRCASGPTQSDTEAYWRTHVCGGSRPVSAAMCDVPLTHPTAETKHHRPTDRLTAVDLNRWFGALPAVCLSGLCRHRWAYCIGTTVRCSAGLHASCVWSQCGRHRLHQRAELDLHPARHLNAVPSRRTASE
jgi:hypothetical protein